MRLRIVLLGVVIVGSVPLSACQDKAERPPPETPRSASAGEPTTASPSTIRFFDHDAMQADVLRILTEDYRLAAVSDVSCPPDQIVDKAREFQCEATIDGAPRQVPIRVRGVGGEYTVGMPVTAGEP